MDRDGGFELHSINSALLAAQVPEDRMKLLLYKCTATGRGKNHSFYRLFNCISDSQIFVIEKMNKLFTESTNPCDRASTFTKCFWSHSKTADSEQETGISAMK